MLQWFRRRTRPLALAALVSLAGLTGLSAAVHGGSDCHDECVTGVMPHDPWSHGIGNASADAEHALHCILCHWTRTVRPSTEAVHELSRPVTHDVRSFTDVPGARLQALQAQPPLRSPPFATAVA